MEQRTRQWELARLGKITASRFKDAMVQPRSKAAREAGELSQTAESLALDVIAEILTGEPTYTPTTTAMQWGIDNEPLALASYRHVMGNDTTECGFIQSELYPGVGASPDALLGDEGVIEIKCPFSPREHLRTFLSSQVPDQYVAQVQGQLWVTGRQFAHFVSYDPRIDPNIGLVVVFVERDDQFISTLRQAVVRVLKYVEDALLQIRDLSIGGKR